MSGTPPYTYLEYGDTIAEGGLNTLLYLYDSAAALTINDGGYDLFEGGSAAVRPDQTDVVFPTGSYDISYPYCRIALRYNMSDVRGDPQIGQLVPQAPNLAIQLQLVGCDLTVPVSVVIDTQPVQPGHSIDLIPGYTPTEFIVIIDTTIAQLPLRMYFTVTNVAGRTKRFWIGVRSARGAQASGSVVPGRPLT